MKKVTFQLLLVAFVMAAFVGGCRDESDPEYWLDKMYDRPWREEALKNLNNIFSTVMQENDNDLQNPKVQEVVNIMVPELIKGFKTFTRDKFNRADIIKLLAQMNDDRSVDVFMEGLDIEASGDATMFQVAANAMRRQAVAAALPKLIAAHKFIVAARVRRAGAAFTTSENEIEQSFISASVKIVAENPDAPQKAEIVQILCEITETSDMLQDLRLNMKAMKGLGKIGDKGAVPTLIKGIAMRGKRQPVALGQIAFASLQQIHDRDAVVDAVLKFARGEDKAFNAFYKEELKTDPAMKNPTWYIQQTTTFLGQLHYLSPAVVKFLEEELNHTDPDDVDRRAVKAMQGGPITFDAEKWATMRRNWAAVSLSTMGYEPVIDVVTPRIKFKGRGKSRQLDITMEEVVGYIRSFGLLQYPEKTCKTMRNVAAVADDSLRDKTYYNAALMCGEDWVGPMEKARKKIDCQEILELRFPNGWTGEEKTQTLNECEIMKKRITGYIEKIQYGNTCGDNLDCYLKTIEDHTNKNVERAIYSAFRIGRDDPSQRDVVVAALIKNLNNPSKVALKASISALDKLTPEGDPKLIARIQQVYKNFARQSTYKDRARLLEAFIGRVRNRGRS